MADNDRLGKLPDCTCKPQRGMECDLSVCRCPLHYRTHAEWEKAQDDDA